MKRLYQAPDKLKENPVWQDVVKFYLALTDNQKGFEKAEYIREKLMQIIKRDTNWHALVNKAFEDQIKETL